MNPGDSERSLTLADQVTSIIHPLLSSLSSSIFLLLLCPCPLLFHLPCSSRSDLYTFHSSIPLFFPHHPPFSLLSSLSPSACIHPGHHVHELGHHVPSTPFPLYLHCLLLFPCFSSHSCLARGTQGPNGAAVIVVSSTI